MTSHDVDPVLVRAAIRASGASLRERGLQPLDSTSFIWRLDPDLPVTGIVTLNYGASKRGGAVDIYPLIGVEHHQIETVASEIDDRPYSPPEGYATVGRPLASLVADRNQEGWRFDSPETVSEPANDIADTIVDAGREFVVANASLETIAATIRDHGLREVRRRSLPVALHLLDRHEEARAFVEEEIAVAEERGGADSAELKARAQRLETYFSARSRLDS